ncbi:MAG: 50S ribosomal protein L10 [Cenarchaeum sp. SB0665_bin_23]|nr:50S ribosomal protein L10 [Cenarchaeum sp. SB0667_bin_13]MXY38020.1 50S ribosomal protein L10 [Cenarchaeum sp. SB0664_bin_35]MXY60638.1 50S ribosomal protein L10 [Cenarchaeum sp. SB0665_bin_23]MXZ93857.1 50S ribosomal protein L10 [Cenarchaeum sp. SB0666_bin_15]MYB47387.1 50S ribosomal protein L10 [Cenarchaeum sp. SB0662_bin_33]MYC80178.1 50S ribosomal protein L10 [Cenarchaeum sp. SB0661_bin_35]MYD58877.1 50S ribosomal protein L10 [Cenarchaeum sp. SB0678_bin_8]MYG33161.1 50S ribosomal prot
MHENRTTYPEKKTRMYCSIQEMSTKYKSMALIRLEKVRASQILELKKKLKGDVEFVSIKNRVVVHALEKLALPGIEKMLRELTGQCMLVFSNMSPFRLNLLLAKNKTMVAARGGDVASIDVVVAARNTGIAPGPMLTEFKDAGIPTKIDQGTIWIAKDTTPAKKGDIINEKLASMLGKLDIKPIEASISLYTAMEDGINYTQEELVVDLDHITDMIAASHQEAVNLSVETGYATPDTILPILAKASTAARSLSIESGYMTQETQNDILFKAHNQALSIIKDTDYTPN